jgi:hypothetical protein
VLVNGCKDLSATLPAGVQDESAYKTPAGAIQKRNVALYAFQQTLQGFIQNTARLTDETTVPVDSAVNTGEFSLDQRILPEQENSGPDLGYAGLQLVRGSANDAIGTLAKYDSAAPPAWRGELFALKGYAEVMLADLFCSGVPLSTLNFEGDFTYRPSSTPLQVYQDAVVQFDSALVLSSDSAIILNLARVGLGRAYLDMGDYAHAAAAVASVPDGFRYQFNIPWRISNTQQPQQPLEWSSADNEGSNGLPFITSQDPRVQQTSFTSSNNQAATFPQKYASALQSPYYSPVTVADGIEARLIQAEAALQAGDPSWLTILNALRTTSTTCTVQTTPSCAASAPAGTGGVAGLPLLVDPGTSAGDTARVNVLFSERAYWLYVTGHRQGDLRRLVRNYHRDQSTVYPTGVYLGNGLGSYGLYGTDVAVPIPTSENPNPYFHGCLDRNA